MRAPASSNTRCSASAMPSAGAQRRRRTPFMPFPYYPYNDKHIGVLTQKGAATCVFRVLMRSSTLTETAVDARSAHGAYAKPAGRHAVRTTCGYVRCMSVLSSRYGWKRRLRRLPRHRARRVQRELANVPRRRTERQDRHRLRGAHSHTLHRDTAVRRLLQGGENPAASHPPPGGVLCGGNDTG